MSKKGLWEKDKQAQKLRSQRDEADDDIDMVSAFDNPPVIEKSFFSRQKQQKQNKSPPQPEPQYQEPESMDDSETNISHQIATVRQKHKDAYHMHQRLNHYPTPRPGYQTD